MAQNAEPTIDTQANNNITIEKAKILLKLTMLFVQVGSLFKDIAYVTFRVSLRKRFNYKTLLKSNRSRF